MILVLNLAALIPLGLFTIGGATTLGGMPWWAYFIDIVLWILFILLFSFLWRWALRPAPGLSISPTTPQSSKLDKRAITIIVILVILLLFILTT